MTEISPVTSKVNNKGQTIIPKVLRDRLKIRPGTVLSWQIDGQSLRVIKLERRKPGSFLEGLPRLGRVPAAPRDKRAVKPAESCFRNVRLNRTEL
jgi:bifunctional DNA-binding transcriptional regulator/antitoxin component of YhaV-PrlF toxin-antitoxin module